MSEPEPDFGALKLEWVVARVVLVLALLGSVAGFFWLGLKPTPVATRAAMSASPAAPGGTGATASQASSTPSTQGQQFCSSTVSLAQSFGVVPAGAKPASDPQKTDVTGRYVCLAGGPRTQYTISVDLICRDLSDEHCFDLFNVTGSDGTVLYQRQG